MSRDDLARVLDGLGFDGSPLEVDLAAFHVAFDDRGRSGVERDLREAALRAERIGVAAPIGAGKTSAARFALDRPGNGLAPIWVSVARDGDEVVTDPRAFLAHVVQTVARQAVRASQLSEAERLELLNAATAQVPLPVQARRLGGKVGAKFWLLNADISGDVTTTLQPGALPRPVSELREVADRVLEAVAAYGLEPVLVIDDSDAFTRDGDPAGHDARVEAFFGPVLAEVTKLRCGLVVAVHDEYEDLAGFRRARGAYGVLQRIVDVPEIVSGQLARILARRVELTAGATRDDVLAGDAVDELAAINRGPARRNLRTVLTIAHQALVDVVQDDRALIERADVRAAATKHITMP